MKKIGFIGTGNMGGALIKGILKAGGYKVHVYDLIDSLVDQYVGLGAVKAAAIQDLAAVCEYLVLTVKPNAYKTVLKEIAQAAYQGCIITVAPGISTDKIKAILPNCRVVRTMPNTPALIGEGVTLIACESSDSSQYADITDILSAVGKTVCIPESLMDPGIALSGSSPAFVYAFIDALADGAVSEGFPKKKALEIAAQTVLGSAKMVLETGVHPAILRDNVCSPGGTTIAAMHVLEQEGFKPAVIKAMRSCTEKAKEMSENF